MILRDMFNQSIQGGIDNMDEIEKLQNIIFRECDIDRGTQWESLKRIARFVMRREIEAELRGISYAQESQIYHRNNIDRIAELHKHLTKIGE